MKLIITDSIPTPSYQRSGIFAYDDFRFFLNKGFDVKMIVLYRITYERRFLFNIRNQADFICHQIKELKEVVAKNPNIEFIPYFSFIKPFVFKEDLFLFKKSKFAKMPFDQITVHNMLHTGLNVKWIRLQFPGSKIVLKEHDNWLLYSKLVRYFAIRCINKYDEIFANSESTKQSFLKVFSDYNIIDKIPKIEVDYPKFKINTKKIIKLRTSILQVLTVANLIKEKGFEESFAIFKIFEDAKIEWFWTIIGKGPLYDTIIQMAADFNFSHKISILPEVQKPDLYEYMKKADIYLQLSYMETFGITPIEAFSYYNKLVVSDYITSITELGLDLNSNILTIIDISDISAQKEEIIGFIQKDEFEDDFERVLPELNRKVNHA